MTQKTVVRWLLVLAAGLLLCGCDEGDKPASTPNPHGGQESFDLPTEVDRTDALATGRAWLLAVKAKRWDVADTYAMEADRQALRAGYSQFSYMNGYNQVGPDMKLVVEPETVSGGITYTTVKIPGTYAAVNLKKVDGKWYAVYSY